MERPNLETLADLRVNSYFLAVEAQKAGNMTLALLSQDIYIETGKLLLEVTKVKEEV